MKLKICKSTAPFCLPMEREDRFIDIKEEGGVPVGNALALDVYNNPENYTDVYEIIP